MDRSWKRSGAPKGAITILGGDGKSPRGGVKGGVNPSLREGVKNFPLTKLCLKGSYSIYKGGALSVAQPDSPSHTFLIPRLSFQSDSPTNVPFNFPSTFLFKSPFQFPFEISFQVPFKSSFRFPLKGSFKVPLKRFFEFPFNRSFTFPF